MRSDQSRPHQPTLCPSLFPFRPLSPSAAASDVIRGASGQIMFPMPAPLAPVATRITVTSPPSTFASNFSAARCTNLPRTAYSVSVQWTSAAAPNLPACANITFWSGAGCTGTSSLSLKPARSASRLCRGSVECLSLHSNPGDLIPDASSACLYVTCPAIGTPTPTTDTRGVACAAGYVEARVAVTTAVKVGRYNFSFDPSSRCSRLPDATAPAGVSTVASVQWGSASSLPGGGASGPCSRVSFFPGTTCNGAVMQHIYSYSSDLDNRAATCRCKDGYAVINGTCQDKCNLYCVANASCVRDASMVPDCVCNKGFQYAPNSNTCVDKCTLVNCGPNGKCIKDADGDATCACNAGFQMPPNKITCVDKCDFVTCKANSTCAKDANGNTTCECIKGFERLPGNDACIDNCDLAGFYCEPGSCKKDAKGNPYCECGPGYRLSAEGRFCIDICDTVDCGEGTCVKRFDEEGNGHAECDCPAGYQVDGSGRCTDICNVVCPSSQTCRRNGDYISYCTEWVYCERNCGYGGMCRIDQVKDIEYCLCDPGYKLSADQLSCIEE
ncbi:unnamed protein product [Closterium sp. Yama58-4]|nr:unnamed protein product [Closterium sp. Yama58-4]